MANIVTELGAVINDYVRQRVMAAAESAAKASLSDEINKFVAEHFRDQVRESAKRAAEEAINQAMERWGKVEVSGIKDANGNITLRIELTEE